MKHKTRRRPVVSIASARTVARTCPVCAVVLDGVTCLASDPRAITTTMNMLKRAPDGEVKELKSALAAEIATMVEAQVQPDLKQAMAAALQWRSPESLEKIKAAVATGGKARMVGRESCLFLEVDTPDGLARVML